MKKTLAMFLSVCVLLPTLAFADSAGTQTQLMQLTTILAQLEAQITAIQTNLPLACAVATNKAVVHVNEQFVLAWGSVGAVAPSATSTAVWSQNGSSLVTMDRIGAWSYPFTFYAADGSSVKCTTKITVVR